jgi:hypothetical protein
VTCCIRFADIPQPKSIQQTNNRGGEKKEPKRSIECTYYGDAQSMSSDDDSAEAETPSGFSEVGREVREAERALAAKRTEYDELVKTAQSEYDRSTTSLFFVKIRRFDKLVKALDFVRISRAHVPMAIFARSKPKPDNTSMVLRTVKEYLVAPYQNFWQYCLRVDFGVMLEECIRVDQPTYLHFDIEIKCLRVEDIPTVAFSEVLKTQLELIDHVLPTELLDAIGLNHDAVCIDPLTEEECRAGLKIMLEHIRLFLRDHIEQPYQDPDFRIDPDYRIDPDFRIVSGCRPSKLSFHVVCKGLLVDSNVGSMSLLVYEIARSFAISNLQALYDCEFRRDDGDAENRFRYRALMLSQAVTSLPMPEQHGDEHDERLLEATDAISWGFTGYDDTPIDEAIYSKNHLLRAPGACKVDTSALHPVVDVNNDPLMVEERKFSNLFPPTNQGFLAWCEQLIGFPRVGDVRQDVLLTGMKPTESCPFSRRWYSQVGDSAEAPPTNICPLVRYSGSYFQEKRPMIREIRGLYSHEIRNAIDGSGSALTSFHERVAPDEVFMAEDGRSKAFRLFNPGDWLFHVHGGARERTPSAKVFFGGFRCFGCNTSFAVPQSTPWEAAYPFLAEETVTSRDPKQFMPDLDWVALLQRKFVVINANMGSGKTEQLVRLVKVAEQEDRTVLVVSFRRFLATQQAKRLDILCYLDLSPAELGAGPKMLTLVLNSLLKIGEEAYNIVVLDECGLIRRHFFSRTMVNILPAVYKAYRRVLQTADNVIMLQDGLTRNDIQFHTEIDNVDCEDRSKVSAYSFEKPVEIHPLQCTTDFYMALQNLRECYRTACKDKTMEHPFMVMCNSAVVAEFLVCQLRETAKAEGTKPERIQGIWARIKARSEFCRRFSEDPNGVASEVDVIVCTSVIGAGFSINCHFQSFHAFLLTDILTFLEEQQFLQRLRWIMANCPTNAIRQSYLYVQKGHGRPFEYERVQVNFDTVRKVLLRATGVDGRRRSTLVDTADNEMLAETHARIETERAASRSMHDDLWRNYGTDVLQSPFVVLEPSEEESAQAKKELQREFLEWARKRIKDVKTFIDLTDSENLGEHDLGEHIAAVECAAGMELFIQSNADAVVADLEGCFGRFLKPLKYIVNLTFDEKKATKLLTGPSARQTWISGVKGMVSQLTSLYSNLVPGQSKHRWQTMQERGFNTSTLKRTAHLVLAEHVLHGVLGVGGVIAQYLVERSVPVRHLGFSRISDVLQ